MSTMKDRSDDPLYHEQKLYHGAIFHSPDKREILQQALVMNSPEQGNEHSHIWPCSGCEFNGRRKEGNGLFNDALNTFYLRLYGVRHMVKDHSDSEKGNLLLPHRLLFPISSNDSFICTIPQTG